MQPLGPDTEFFIGHDHLAEVIDKGSGAQIIEAMLVHGLKNALKSLDHSLFKARVDQFEFVDALENLTPYPVASLRYDPEFIVVEEPGMQFPMTDLFRTVLAGHPETYEM